MREDVRMAIAEHLTMADLEGEKVVLNLESGQYFGLNEVASRILEIVEEDPATIGQVVDRLLEEYDVERDVLKQDVIRFVREMKAHQLIGVDEESLA